MAELHKMSNVSLGQQFQTQTSISDESILDFPHKPNQKNEIPAELMSSQKPKSHPSNHQQSSNDKETHLHQNKDLQLSYTNEKLPKYHQTSNYTVLSPCLSTKNVNVRQAIGYGKTLMPTNRLADKRTSINSYNKRIVGLTNNSNQHHNVTRGPQAIDVNGISSKQINQISTALMPQSMKSVRDKKISLEFSELSTNQLDSKAISRPLYSTRGMQKPQLPGKNTTLKQETKSLLSQNVSPKKIISPIHSLSSLNKNITNKVGGNKMTLKKQMTEASLLQLNKSEQQLATNQNNNNSEYQTITSQYRVGSPDTSKLLKNFKSNQNSISKKPTLISQRSEQLIRNLSQEGKKMLTKHTDVVHSQRAMVLDKKRGSVRYYSPTQVSTLNKALQRISSVGELQRMKNQIIKKQRESSIHQKASKECRLSTMHAAQFILSQSKSKKEDVDEKEDDDENEYMTNQEKLWNAIETASDIKIIKDLLMKRDVDVNSKNIFDDNWTALHYAVHEGFIEVVKILADDYKATIDARSSTNKTPFHLACIRGEENLIDFLLERGANPQVVDRDGCTPMHYLCETQNYDMVKRLLPVCAASKDVRNRFGKKPADLVKDAEVKRTLRNFSSRLNSQRQSQSRERSKSTYKTTVQVMKLRDDKDVLDSIEQMFRKFSLNKKQEGQRSDSKKRREVNDRRQSNQVNVNAIKPERRNTIQTSRIPLTSHKHNTNLQSTSTVPQKKISTPKQMFQQQQTTTLKKNLSPRPQTSASRNSEQVSLQPTDKTTKLRHKIDQVLDGMGKGVIEEDQTLDDEDDDYQVMSDKKKAPFAYTEARAVEERGSSSQRTGESSQLNIDACTVISARNKATAFSLLNRLSDSTATQPPAEEKVGPSSFIAHQLLGTGSFGEVFLVEKVSSGKFFAMKVLSKSKIMGHNLTRYAQTERNVMSVVNHPFVVKLNYAFQTQEKLFLILDYCPGGDLAEYLQLEKRFNEDKARLYSSEILLALEELHRKDIIFRDLKPDNVVLDAEGHAVLTDFGLSKEGVLREGMAKSFCGSYAYLAPEMLKKAGHGKAVDWYLLGVIIYEMLCGVPPYYANNKEELFENIKTAPLDLPAHLSPTARDVIARLLNRNPRKRLGTYGGAEEIKKHPFFRAIDWAKLYNRQYKAPEPYLKKRFDNFLLMSPEQQTNTEVCEQLRQQELLKGPYNLELHVPGWSFVSPAKE